MKIRLHRWTISEAEELFRQIEPFAKSAGFHLAIGGSVFRNGEGADLNMVAVPVKLDATPDGLLSAIEKSVAISRGASHDAETTVTFDFTHRSRSVEILIPKIKRSDA